MVPRLLACLLGSLTVCATLAATPSAFPCDIRLEEVLGHTWAADLVHRRVTVPEPGLLLASQAALFNGERAVPMQLDNLVCYPDGSLKEADVWFRSDLPANGTRTFTLRAVSKLPKEAGHTDLKVKTDDGVLELANSRTAVRLPAGSSATAAPGPLQGVKLPSGTWTPPARFAPKQPVLFPPLQGLVQALPDLPAEAPTGYQTQILAQGPIFVRARITYQFPKAGQYTVDVTLRAEEPLVRVDERYRQAGTVEFPLGLRPTTACYQSNPAPADGRVTPLTYVAAATPAMFVGWSFFFADIAATFALTGDPSGNLLGLQSTDADWLPFPYNQALLLHTDPKEGLTLRGALDDGQRHWALYVGKESDFPKPLDHIGWWLAHVALPLDKVANWQLTWPGMDELAFPHTFFSRDELPAVRTRLQAEPAIADFIKRLQPTTFTNAATLYLYTGDAQYLEALYAAKDRYVDGLPTAFLDKLGLHAQSYLNNMQVSDELLLRYVGYELLLGSDRLSPAEHRALLIQLAFIQHLMADEMYWPPNYGFSPQLPDPYPAYVQGTPNQKICYLTARGILGCVLRNHPQFPVWLERVLAEHDRCVADSVAPGGAHVESPFYSSRDTMRFGPFWSALTRAGVGGPDTAAWLTRLRNCYQYMGDMLTPPEPRMAGRRVYHAIGRSSSGVVDPTIMIAAEPFAAGDPAFLSRLRWCWEQQDKPAPDCMGSTGGRDMSLTLLAFSRLGGVTPAATPPLQSVRWDGMGAVFRSQVGSGFESNVLFRHGQFCWNLYEGNNGAVYFYGKGVPLLPRFGGYWMEQKGQPNLMSIPFGNRLIFADGLPNEEWTNGLGDMTACATLGPQADYASGVTRDKAWRRSVLFAKDLTKEDPEYLLVRDDVLRPGVATALHWWIMSKAVNPDGYEKPGVVLAKGHDADWMANLGKNWKDAPKLTGQLQRFEGLFGVDLDLYIAQPAQPKLVTDAVGVGPGMAYCVNPKAYDTQQLLRIENEPGKGYLTLLAPRWPQAQAPQYRTIADGAGVAVSGPAGEDRLFLGDKPVIYTDNVVTLAARAGYARHGGGVTLRLMVVDGSITADGITLACSQPAALVADAKGITVFCSKGADVRVQLPPGKEATNVNVVHVN